MDINVPALRPTRDHVIPKSRGGRKMVWCCFICNAVKRDMNEDAWAIYRAEHDEWWVAGRRAQKAMRWRPTYIIKGYRHDSGGPANDQADLHGDSPAGGDL
jgi:hypothetical protein